MKYFIFLSRQFALISMALALSTACAQSYKQLEFICNKEISNTPCESTRLLINNGVLREYKGDKQWAAFMELNVNEKDPNVIFIGIDYSRGAILKVVNSPEKGTYFAYWGWNKDNLSNVGWNFINASYKEVSEPVSGQLSRSNPATPSRKILAKVPNGNDNAEFVFYVADCTKQEIKDFYPYLLEEVKVTTNFVMVTSCYRYNKENQTITVKGDGDKTFSFPVSDLGISTSDGEGFWQKFGRVLNAVNQGLQAGNNSINNSIQNNPAPVDLTPHVTQGRPIQLQGQPKFAPQYNKTATCSTVYNAGVASTQCN